MVKKTNTYLNFNIFMNQYSALGNKNGCTIVTKDES